MMRSIVCGASWVCSVAKTRWPVSAAVIAVEIVSRSRISPTRIDVGVLAQHVLQRAREPVRVGADLALVHDAALVLVQELDRVLDRHDVALALGVDDVDHAGERRRLARPGRAGDDHEPALEAREVGHDRRQAELVDLP